jgi:Thioredoxin-like domain
MRMGVPRQRLRLAQQSSKAGRQLLQNCRLCCRKQVRDPVIVNAFKRVYIHFASIFEPCCVVTSMRCGSACSTHVAGADDLAAPVASATLKHLDVQASTRILAASDPLQMLEGLTASFPSLAAALSRDEVTATLLREFARSKQQLPSASQMLVNGLAVRACWTCGLIMQAMRLHL